MTSATDLPDHPFIPEMVRQTRAFDSYGVNDGLPPAKILEPYVVTREQRREMPVIGDPDEELIARLKAFYAAIAMRIEAASGLMAKPMYSITHEGFGRVIISVGHLLVLDRALRDVHRFGFDSLSVMCDEADRMIQQALALIEQHPAAAAG